MTASIDVLREPVSRRQRAIWWLGVPLGLAALVALLAPWLPLPDPTEQDLTNVLAPPAFLGGSADHPLGTDQLGRDLLVRLISGARLTFFIAVVGTLVAAVPGTLLGMIAGYAGGWADRIITRLIDAQLALPFVLLAIAIIAARGRSLTVLIVVLALIGWAQYARVVRAETLKLSVQPFVLGLRAAGASWIGIVLRHILPNLAGTVLVLSTLQIGAVILAESALSFLGLGVSPPSISWGAMLADGRDHMQEAWWLAAFPGVAITAVVLLVNLFGDALVSEFDPRRRRF
jgi:peptide/nickel transport system permease protein